MNTERLIECVRRHTFLYDVYHKEYKNVNLKTTIWELIGRELNQSGEAVKCKWKSIRDGYVKYKKQSKAASVSGKKNIAYLWSSHLSFLDNYRPPSSYVVNDPSPSSSSFTQQPREYDVSQDQVYLPSASNISPLLTSLEVQTEQIPSTSKENLKQSKKIKREVNHVDEVLKHLNKKKRKVDGIDHLFLSYAETFKKFPPKEQAILKLKLAKLFSNTELKLLQHSDESRASSASPAHSSSSDGDDTLHELIDNAKPAEFCTDIKKEQ